MLTTVGTILTERGTEFEIRFTPAQYTLLERTIGRHEDLCTVREAGSRCSCGQSELWDVIHGFRTARVV